MHRVYNFKFKLRTFKKGLLQKISGTRRKVVAGKWKKLYNKELHDLYSSPNFMRVLNHGVRWVGHVACEGEEQ
jgi:vacuolar-type H+-ATPase subunit C/Vma6